VAAAPPFESNEDAQRQLLQLTTLTGAATVPAPPVESSVPPRRTRVTAVSQLESERDKVVALKALAQDIAGEDVPRALQCTRQLASEVNRTEALNAFIDRAPHHALPEMWTVLRDVRSNSVRLRSIEALAVRMVNLEAAQAHALWSDILRFLASRHRGRLLEGVRVLAPTLTMLGGDGAAQRTALTINEVCAWWP